MSSVAQIATTDDTFRLTAAAPPVRRFHRIDAVIRFLDAPRWSPRKVDQVERILWRAPWYRDDATEPGQRLDEEYPGYLTEIGRPSLFDEAWDAIREYRRHAAFVANPPAPVVQVAPVKPQPITTAKPKAPRQRARPADVLLLDAIEACRQHGLPAAYDLWEAATDAERKGINTRLVALGCRKASVKFPAYLRFQWFVWDCAHGRQVWFPEPVRPEPAPQFALPDHTPRLALPAPTPEPTPRRDFREHEAETPAGVFSAEPSTIAVNGVPYGLQATADGYDLTRPSGASYRVTASPQGPSCECPDFRFRREGLEQGGCKHIRALRAEGLLAPILPRSTAADGWEPLPASPATGEDVAAYDLAVYGLAPVCGGSEEGGAIKANRLLLNRFCELTHDRGEAWVPMGSYPLHRLGEVLERIGADHIVVEYRTVASRAGSNDLIRDRDRRKYSKRLATLGDGWTFGPWRNRTIRGHVFPDAMECDLERVKADPPPVAGGSPAADTPAGVFGAAGPFVADPADILAWIADSPDNTRDGYRPGWQRDPAGPDKFDRLRKLWRFEEPVRYRIDQALELIEEHRRAHAYDLWFAMDDEERADFPEYLALIGHRPHRGSGEAHFPLTPMEQWDEFLSCCLHGMPIG